MIYLLVDLKIVLALHPLIKIKADLNGVVIRGRGANSNRGACQILKSYGDAKQGRGANSSRSNKPRKYGSYNTNAVLKYMPIPVSTLLVCI